MTNRIQAPRIEQVIGLPARAGRAVVRFNLGSINELLLKVLVLCSLVTYLFLLQRNLGQFLFSSEWTTDDALQQVFPLLDVLHPGRFGQDLIAETMRGYLAPLHWWASSFFTWLSGDVILASHAVEVIQVVGCIAFLFLAVSRTSSGAAALFAVLWFLHTRPAIQRLVGGLPRGWSGIVLAATLYAALSRKHYFALVALLLGCLTSPPAAMIAAIAYGLSLVLDVIDPKTRVLSIRPFVTLLLLSPLYIGVVLWVVHRPDSAGQMVDFATASAMPEFQRPHGRFPFLPLDSIGWDLRMYAYQPFLHRLFDPGQAWKRAVPYMLGGLTALFFVVGLIRKRRVFPRALVAYLAAVVIVYSLSRLLAFKLYVPNRHLQIPMTIFWISWFSIGLSNLLHPISLQKLPSGRIGRSSPLKKREGAFLPEFISGVPLALGFAILSTIIWIGTGDGLYGTANYNYSRSKKGEVFNWIRGNTEAEALFAGHPTHIDGLPLFGERRVLATTETTHPFYPVYYAEMKRRLEISLRAHYASSLQEVIDILRPEGVNYFVFSKKRFYPEALTSEEFFAPLDTLVKELTAKDPASYAYKQLPTKVTEAAKSFMPFRDEQSVVVKLDGLQTWLHAQDLAVTTNQS
jgi:hypothetical protein